jgi:hypothetical protein
MKTSRLFNLSDKTTAHDRVSGRKKWAAANGESFCKQSRWAELLCRLGAPRVCLPRTERVRKERLTSWTGDVYSDIETEMLARPKKRKSVGEVVGRKGLVE